MKDPAFSDLINLADWQKIQDAFSDVTRICLRTVDTNGNLIVPKTTSCAFSDKLLKGTPYGLDSYNRGWPTFLGGKAIVDKNLSFICPPGFHNFIAPLRLDHSKPIAYIIMGPAILVMRKQKIDYLKLAAEIDVDLDKLFEAIQDVRVISFYRMQSLVELIRQVGEFIVKLAYDKSLRGPEVLRTAPERFKSVLHIVLDVAMQASGADMGSIMFKERGTDQLSIRVARNLPEEVVNGVRVVSGEGIAGTVMKDRTPILIDDSKPDNRIAKYLKRPYLKSSMVLPILADNKAYGVINLGALEVSAVRFNEQNLDRMNNLINLATDALYTPVKQYVGSKSAYFDQVL
jgi:ligand-binding sensor protein